MFVCSTPPLPKYGMQPAGMIMKMHFFSKLLLSLCCCVFIGFVVSGQALAQSNAPTTFDDALRTLIDDNTPGVLRIGDVQILYGHIQFPCDYPAQLCTVTVKFQAPFIEIPVVNLTSLSNFSTHKSAYATLVPDHLTTTSFKARVQLQANIPSLKRIPWMAIGRWR